MTSKNFLTFNAVICFGFSCLLVFFPVDFTSRFTYTAESITGFGIFLARSYGCLIFAEGLCFWMGRHAPHGSQFLKTILCFSLVSNALTAGMYFLGYILKHASGLILPIIFFVGLLACIATYLLLKKA